MAYSDSLITSLSKSYDELLPLLEYLRARLKYDTVRWLRAYGSKDDIIFSTRIKTFDRVLDKLVRAKHPLTMNTGLIDLAIDGLMEDMIGIRFICFDAFSIFRLIHYFMTTERVSTSKRSIYTSRRTMQEASLFSYLQSNGFSPSQKDGREYEDINFIMKFSHPIDQFFESGRKAFATLEGLADVKPATPDRLDRVQQLFDGLQNKRGHLISHIPKFPIECQIATATQHIYNRTQRPQYQYVLQRKEGEEPISPTFLEDLSGQLSVLKTNLIAVDQSVYFIHRKSGIRYQLPLQINPGHFFGLAGRLPKDILNRNVKIEKMNALLKRIIQPDIPTMARADDWHKVLEDIKEITVAIAQRAVSHEDIAAHKLLTIADLEELSHPEIVFWGFQRLVIFSLCILLLYTPDPEIAPKITGAIRFAPKFGDEEKSGYKLDDPDLVIDRLFQKLEQTDHAVATKLEMPKDLREPKEENHFPLHLFYDPLVQWRYASYLYSKRDYPAALAEMRVGIAVYDRLDALTGGDPASRFEIPERVMFCRRMVEYELCQKVKDVPIATNLIAGMLAFCGAVTPHEKDWTQKLQEVVTGSKDIGEQARCLGFQILLRLCALSDGGVSGKNLSALHREFSRSFEELDTHLERKGGKAIKKKTWWLLTIAIMRPEKSEENLTAFREEIEKVKHHTPERIEFEKMCAVLVRLWTQSSPAEKTRKDFSASLFDLLYQQTASLASSARASHAMARQMADMQTTITKWKEQVAEGKKVEPHAKLSSWLSSTALDVAEKFIVDLTVAALQKMLGF